MTKQPLCPKSGQRSIAFPGRDQCEHCGRIVRTKLDGTYQEHRIPTEADLRRQDD